MRAELSALTKILGGARGLPRAPDCPLAEGFVRGGAGWQIGGGAGAGGDRFDVPGFPVAMMTGPWGFPGTGTSVTVTGGVTVFPVDPTVTGFPETGTAVAVVNFGTPDTVHTGDT